MPITLALANGLVSILSATHTHTKKLWYKIIGYSIVQNLNINRVLKWFLDLIGLEQHIARIKKPYEYGKLMGCPCIWLHSAQD